MPATGLRRGEIVPKLETEKSFPETPQGAKPSGTRPRKNLATSGRLMPWEQDSNVVSDVDSPKQRPSQSQAFRDRSKENFNNSTVITPRSKITGHLSLTPRRVLSPKTPAGVPKYSRHHQYDARKQMSLPTCCDEAHSNGCSPQLMCEHNEVKTQLEAALLVCEVEEMGNTTHTLTAKEYEDQIHELEQHLATALEAVETVKLLDGNEGGGLQTHAISLEMKVAALTQEKDDLRLALDKVEERLAQTHSAWEMSVNREREARQMYDEASELLSIASLEKERAQERGSQMEGRLADAVNERERAVADMRAQRDEATKALQTSNAAAALAQAVREEQEQKHAAEVEALQAELDRMRERSVFLEGNFGQVERHRIEEEQMADEKIERMREHMDRLSRALSEEQRRASKFEEEAKNSRGENEALLTEMEGLAARIEELELEALQNHDLKQSLGSEAAAHLEYEYIDHEFETVEQELFRLHKKLDENQAMWQKRLDRAYQRLGLQPGQRLTPMMSTPKIGTPTIRSDVRQTAASPLALYRATKATPVAVDRATPRSAVGVPKGTSPSAAEPADGTALSLVGTRSPTTVGPCNTLSAAAGDTDSCSLSASVVESSIAETAIQTGFPTAVGAVYLDMLSHYNTEHSNTPATCETEGPDVSSTPAGLDESDPAYLVTKNNMLLMLSPRTSDGYRERSPYIIKYFSAEMDDDKDDAEDCFTSSARGTRHVESPNSFARWMHSDNGEVGDAQFLEVLNGTKIRSSGWHPPAGAATRLPSNASSSSSLSSRTSQKPHKGPAAPPVMDDDFFIKLIKRPTPVSTLHHTTSISEAFTSTLSFLGGSFLGGEKPEKKKEKEHKPYKTNIVTC